MAETLKKDLREAEDFPLLETGYHMMADEFRRRYKLMPPGVRAELIEGIVYMASPTTIRHSRPHAALTAWAWMYASETPGVEVDDAVTVRLSPKDEYQPDVVLSYPIGVGGAARVEDDYLVGAPELAIEVSNSTKAMDLHEKLLVYKKAGVREYLVWQVNLKKADWFVNRNGEFTPFVADGEGILKSEAFPGLWLSVPALVDKDKMGIRRALERGLATAEHADFVKRLSGGGK